MAITCPPELPCGASSGTADQDLEPGRSFEKVVQLKFDSGRGEWPISWLSFAAGTYAFRVTVTYQRTEDEEETTTAEVPVPFVAALSALLGGALAGAILVGSIGTLRRLLAIWRGQQWTFRQAVLVLAVFAFLELPIGLLTAVVAMVVAHISTEFVGVLRIELNDVWAGVVVGMVAQASTGPVAEALKQYLPVPDASVGATTGS